jgi:hypothetical protein
LSSTKVENKDATMWRGLVMKTIFRLERMLLWSFIVITLVAYYLLTIQSIMLEQNTLKCIIILSKKRF